MRDIDFFIANINVSRETLDRLIIYAELLKKWNPAINLVAPSTINTLWDRHMLDSAQIFGLSPEGSQVWCDAGTGGGFPGIVIALLSAEKNPNLKITCIESDVRKAAFLRTVLRETGVKADVLNERIEKISAQSADVFSARALASLIKLLEFSEHHLSPEGTCLFLKGAKYQEEINEALETWRFDLDKFSSVTNSDAVILKLGAIKRA